MSRLSSHGWNLVITVGGSLIPENQISNTLTVQAQEDTSTLCDFSLRLPVGNIDLEFYQGKTVTVDVQRTAQIKRIFTGVVDIAEVDLTREEVNIKCSNRFEELIDTKMAENFGYFSTLVSGETLTKRERIRERLNSVPQSLYFDRFNDAYLTDWEPKVTPDATFSNSDVYYNSLDIELTSRGRILNQIDLVLQYEFDRDYHNTFSFSWTSPIANNICLLLREGYSLTQRAIVEAAIQATGWVQKGDTSFTGIWEAGWFRCGASTIAWSPIHLEGTTTFQKDENGDFIMKDSGKLDANGDPIQERVVDERRITKVIDFRPVYCMGATFELTKRWSQVMREDYKLALISSQSQAQYGTVSEQRVYSYKDKFVSNWEQKYLSFSDEGLGNAFFIDRDNERTRFNQMYTAAVQRAKTDILRTHRQNYIRFKRSLWEDAHLAFTVQLNTSPVTGKGKVSKFTHFFNIRTGESYTNVELALFKSQGSSTTADLGIPEAPTYSPDLTTKVIFLGNHFGEDPTGHDDWHGMIGNKFIGGVRTQYPESFVVITPEIPDSWRASITTEGTFSRNVAIPNQALTINFDGKL